MKIVIAGRPSGSKIVCIFNRVKEELRRYKAPLLDIKKYERKQEGTRQVSSMIHSARPIVTPVANHVFCCFVFLDLKSGDGRTGARTDGRTDGQHVRKR